MVRYEKNGRLDQSFGVKGKVSTNILGNFDMLGGIALQRNGDIVAAGTTQLVYGYGDYDMALVRYKPDGQLNPKFGEAGKITTRFWGEDSFAAVALQKNGNILAVGTAHRVNSDETDFADFALVRYLAR